ncbi:hypothetical protein ASG82_18180 [Mycobacterium sp. Soil538]|nr:hypothetical protein ASG82_18180 [Mycobacterium sp. Soil538]
MAAFISYSSRDRALVEGLLSALRRAHLPVWLDEELGGGESWWREILAQIRGCEVFIVALSKNLLDSKACQAELRYAQSLGKPVLPVQVGPMDTLRINPLSAMQVIDYRNPGLESGIELISSVSALRAKNSPLPDPLPEEPPIPFAYLMRLASTISDPTGLSAQQQTALVAELKAGLDEDGSDEMARRDIAELLRMLRDRSDVTWRTRTEVESVLASLQAPTQPPPAPPANYATGPQPASQGRSAPAYATGPQPAYQSGAATPAWDRPPGPRPPDSGPPGFPPPSPHSGGARKSGSRAKWLIIGGGAVAVIAALVVVVVLVMPGPEPPPPPPPPVAPASVNTLLLTTNEAEGIMGVSNLEPSKVFDQMTESATLISNTACAGAQFNAVKSVYDGSGYSAVADQVFKAEEPQYVWVNQTVVLYPSADQAGKFLRQSADAWRNCAGESVTVTTDDGTTYNWSFDQVKDDSDNQVSQLTSQEGMAGYGCDHAMRAVSNAVIETRACSDQITDEAGRMAEAMAAKVQT